MYALLLIIAVPLVTTVASIYYGWALSTLWNWFVVPLGMMELGIAHAIGLSLTFGLLISAKANQPTKELYMSLCLTPAITVLMGYIVKHFFL